LSAGSPRCVIISGPNGAGKTSLYSKVSLPGQFINADVIAKQLDRQNPETASLAAGRRALSMLAEALSRWLEFTYETTLSSHQAINLIRESRRLSYEIGLVFIALDTADLHVMRVKSRVLKGGHSVPEHIIRRRYDQSFRNLMIAIPLCDEVRIYDNSSPVGLVLKLAINNSKIESNALDMTKSLDARLAKIAWEALGLPHR
jgi:predicted ABC-type ATPase